MRDARTVPVLGGPRDGYRLSLDFLDVDSWPRHWIQEWNADDEFWGCLYEFNDDLTAYEFRRMVSRGDVAALLDL